jgi:ubiquinone/menaquinone biosynthesis C-methylase UbiE
MNFEISNYGIAGNDTLVDIGCGSAYYDRIISNKFPNIHFVLEDLPKDTWSNDLEKFLKKTVVNTPFAPNFKTNSRVVFGTADSIPLGSEKYTLVLCRISMHEFSNRQKMISELSRILNSTGTLLIVEKLSLYNGEKDKKCKQQYLTKEEVISSFKNLQLTDTIRLQPQSENGMLFKFKKKNYS